MLLSVQNLCDTWPVKRTKRSLTKKVPFCFKPAYILYPIVLSETFQNNTKSVHEVLRELKIDSCCSVSIDISEPFRMFRIAKIKRYVPVV